MFHFEQKHKLPPIPHKKEEKRKTISVIKFVYNLRIIQNLSLNGFLKKCPKMYADCLTTLRTSNKVMVTEVVLEHMYYNIYPVRNTQRDRQRHTQRYGEKHRLRGDRQTETEIARGRESAPLGQVRCRDKGCLTSVECRCLEQEGK